MDRPTQNEQTRPMVDGLRVGPTRTGRESFWGLPMKPLNLRLGLAGGLTVGAFAIGSYAANAPDVTASSLAEMAAAVGVPILVLTILGARTNRRLWGHRG